MKKKLLAVMTAVMAAILILACVGAAAKGEAKIKGIYLSDGHADYSNMRPDYNFYLYNFTQSEVTLYEDNTYMIIVSDVTMSGVELADSTNDHTENPRTNTITKIFGTYTAKADELDEDLSIVTLSAPTRIIQSMEDHKYWVDTANWTDAMGKAVAHNEIDGTTGAVVAAGQPLTAAEFLAEAAFNTEKTISVSEKTFSFDFDAFGVKTGFQN